MTYIITGKSDSHHSKVKKGYPSNIFWQEYRSISSINSEYPTRMDVLIDLIKPAFDKSGLRKAKTNKNKYYERLFDYLVKEKCIIKV